MSLSNPSNFTSFPRLPSHRLVGTAAMTLAPLLIGASALAQQASESSAAGSREWVVVGLREPNGPSVASVVEDFRRALASELGPRDSRAVLPASAILAKLGISSSPVSTILTRITDAEGAYQQLALEVARQKFQAGIQELTNVSGEVSVWEATMTAHVLLGMVYLAAQERDASAHAVEELESIYRVAPEFRVSGYSGDPIFLALSRKAEEKVRRLPKGLLRVVLTPKQPRMQVWVDTAPTSTSERVELPAGTYRVRVTDDRDAPRLRSFTHVATIKQGEERVLNVNIEVESSVDPAGGPAFRLPANSDLRPQLPGVLGRHLGSGQMVFVWVDGGKNLRVAVGDSGRAHLVRAAAVPAFDPASGSTALANLAAYVATGKLRPGVVELPLTFADIDLPPQVELAKPMAPWAAPAKFSGLRLGAWTSGGAAAALAAVGIGLVVNASSARSDLDKQYGRDGSVLVPYPSQASYRSARDDQLNAQRWGMGLMVGAGAAAAACATLFALDARTTAAGAQEAAPLVSFGGAAGAPLGLSLAF